MIPIVAMDDMEQVLADSVGNILDVLRNDVTAPDVGETLSIIGTTPSQLGGQVLIGTGAASIIYTPPAGVTGTDTFTYTVTDGNGSEDTATVTVEILPATDLVKIELELTNLAGQPINQHPGGRDRSRSWARVQDLRPRRDWIRGACSVRTWMFCSTSMLVSPVGDDHLRPRVIRMRHRERWRLESSTKWEPPWVRAETTPALGTGEFVLFRQTFRADAAGSGEFPDRSGRHPAAASNDLRSPTCWCRLARVMFVDDTLTIANAGAMDDDRHRR